MYEKNERKKNKKRKKGAPGIKPGATIRRPQLFQCPQDTILLYTLYTVYNLILYIFLLVYCNFGFRH
jgi:hypothetical protein